MISVIQRVTSARVVVGGQTVGSVERGLVALTSVHATDTDDDLKKTVDKLLTLRVFPEGDKAYHLDVTQVGGGLLLVSNFTVAADLTGGRRPALHPAASPAVAKEKFASFVNLVRSKYPQIATGEFGADMEVTIVNDGPLTVIYDSRAKAGT